VVVDTAIVGATVSVGRAMVVTATLVVGAGVTVDTKETGVKVGATLVVGAAVGVGTVVVSKGIAVAVLSPQATRKNVNSSRLARFVFIIPRIKSHLKIDKD
jgi:hypothetical protein